MGLWIQNFKQALRGLRHQGWQAVVSVVGLAVSIVCLTFSVNWLWTETLYDSFRPEYKDLYVVERVDDSTSTQLSHWLWYGLGEKIDSVLGENAQVGLWRMQSGRAKIARTDNLEHGSYAQNLSASVATVRALGCRVLYGSLDEMEKSGDRFILTESLARRLFGRVDVVGESVARFRGRENRTYTVGAVVEDCGSKSNIYYDFVEPLGPSDFEINGEYARNFTILLRTGDAEGAERELSRVDWDGEDGMKLVLTPLRMFHKMGNGLPFLEAYFYPLAFVVLSLLLVLSAVVNLTMAYTSIYLGRTREYTLRRSLGASDGQNACWMLTGVAPVVLSGLLLAVIGIEWLRYSGGVPGDADFLYTVFAWVAGGVVVLCLLAMVYPVWKMRCVYHRSFLGQDGAGSSHSWLLVVQCFACAFLLFLSLGMHRQLADMIYSDLGFDRENILRLYTGWRVAEGADENYNYESIFNDLPQEFRKESGAGITDAIAMRSDIFNRVTTNYIGVIPEALWLQGNVGKDEVDAVKDIVYMEIPYRAMDFFHIRTVHGGTLSVETEQPGRLQVLFNRAAMQEFGLTYPKQAKLYTWMMTGHEYMAYQGDYVHGHYIRQALSVEDEADIYLNDFRQQERPLMLVGVPENHECPFVELDAVYVRYAPGRREDAEAAMRRVLQKFDVPEEQIYISTLNEYISGNYKEETYYANLLSALTVFSVLITFSGVFSMLLYSLRLRRRSMAIRRVMGAGFRDVFRPQLRSYLLYVVAGGVLAYFPAALLMHKWMEYFHYGETPGVGLMAVIVCGMCAVVSIIVYGQVRRCMNDKPVEVLRPES